MSTRPECHPEKVEDGGNVELLLAGSIQTKGRRNDPMWLPQFAPITGSMIEYRREELTAFSSATKFIRDIIGCTPNCAVTLETE